VGSIERVPFALRAAWPADRVYACLRAADGSFAQLSEMEQAADGTWELTLRLRAGRYFYRFYAGHGDVVVVVPGWDAAPIAQTMGLDTVVDVTATTRGREGCICDRVSSHLDGELRMQLPMCPPEMPEFSCSSGG